MNLEARGRWLRCYVYPKPRGGFVFLCEGGQGVLLRLVVVAFLSFLFKGLPSPSALCHLCHSVEQKVQTLLREIHQRHGRKNNGNAIRPSLFRSLVVHCARASCNKGKHCDELDEIVQRGACRRLEWTTNTLTDAEVLVMRRVWSDDSPILIPQQAKEYEFTGRGPRLTTIN